MSGCCCCGGDSRGCCSGVSGSYHGNSDWCSGSGCNFRSVSGG